MTYFEHYSKLLFLYIFEEISVLHSVFETSLICTVSCKRPEVHLSRIQTHTIYMFPLKVLLNI